MTKIFIVEENVDRNEGKGPMRMVPNSGFFTDEDKAWEFADTLYGVQGRKPETSWRNSKMGDVTVVTIFSHDSDYFKRKRDIESRLSQTKLELHQLEQEYKKYR